MKYLQFIIIFLYPLTLFSQISVVNTSLNDKSQKQLYKALDNRLIVSGIKPYKSVSFAANKAEPYVLNDTTLFFRPSRIGFDTFRVFSNNKLIYEWPFIVDTIPYSIVRVGSAMDTVLTIKQILLSPFLTVIFPFTNWNHQWSVWSFSSFITEHAEGNEVEEHSTSKQLTERQLKIIRQLKPGDKIFFENIRGGGPDSRTVKFPSFTVHIK